nr:unnamed protein product [Digitaria exilis]
MSLSRGTEKNLWTLGKRLCGSEELGSSLEEDKARLVQETGLQLKQINNWFINQRKRNWHSNPASSSSDKSKRKRYGYEKLH